VGVPGEGDCGAFAFDEGVEGEVDGPVSGEVEGAAVGGEAHLRGVRMLFSSLW